MPSTPSLRPIGVFDSGVGGLSVLREIRRLLPHEDLCYVADSGHAPYGDRALPFIQARAQAIAGFFHTRQVKAIVVACNTASGAAAELLRASSVVPIIAIEPAIKPAAQQTRCGVIGVLATSQTLVSPGVARLVAAHGRDVRILLQACPGLVERVERADLTGPQTRALVAGFVEPLLAQGADTLVLGCTHYPFLREVIAQVAGAGVMLIDPAAAVARQLARCIESGHDPARVKQTAPGREWFWTSGDSAWANQLMPALWGGSAVVHALPAPAETSPEEAAAAAPTRRAQGL